MVLHPLRPLVEMRMITPPTKSPSGVGRKDVPHPPLKAHLLIRSFQFHCHSLPNRINSPTLQAVAAWPTVPNIYIHSYETSTNKNSECMIICAKARIGKSNAFSWIEWLHNSNSQKNMNLKPLCNTAAAVNMQSHAGDSLCGNGHLLKLEGWDLYSKSDPK